MKTTEGMWWLSIEESGYVGLFVDRLSGDESEKKVWLQSAAGCGGMPWNGKEEKIMGTGCNHHEMMVTTEKRNPVNIIFYLSIVISPMFLGSVRTTRFPKIRKIHTRLKEQEPRKQERWKSPPFQSSLSFITLGFPSRGVTGRESAGVAREGESRHYRMRRVQVLPEGKAQALGLSFSGHT